MEKIVQIVAPKSQMDFAFKGFVTLVIGNLFAMATVYSVHGFFPSGLRGQIVETTIIALPFTFGFLKIIGYLRKLQIQLSELAMTDVLSGLPNRRAFFANSEALRQESGEDGYLFLADADYFKRINDTYGHDVGDICLQAIARRLEELIPDGGVIARIGGEEFGVFLSGRNHEAAVILATDLSKPIAMPKHQKIADLKLTLSTGVVALGQGQSMKKALVYADKALYRAKADGRGRAVFWPLHDNSAVA